MSVHYNCALALTTLGDRENALNHLEKAVELGYSSKLVALDAGFTALRGLPTFDKVAGEF